jgi:ribosome-associated protein
MGLTGVIRPVSVCRVGVQNAVRKAMSPSQCLQVAGGKFVIPAHELQWQFVRSQGPGGQHVNRASTKAVLRFCVASSPSLPAAIRARVLEQQHSRVTEAGDLVIMSQRFREQPRNTADCLSKLRAIIERAVEPPKKRRATRPTQASVVRRRVAKQRQSETKRLRKPPTD